MRSRPISTILVTATAVALFALAVQRPAGQTPAPGAQIPRTADGKPNFSGVWQVLNTAAWNIQDHHADGLPGLPIQFGMPGGMGVVEGNTMEGGFQIMEEACYEGEANVQRTHEFSVYPGLEALKKNRDEGRR